MRLVDDVEAVLPLLRAEAEALMVDSCLIGRASGTVESPDGVVTPTYTPVYEGKCKVQQTIAQSNTPVAGEHQFTVLDAAVHLPVSAPDLFVDDVVTIDASVNDPRLTGRVYRVVEPFRKSFATAQRARVKEVVA